MVALIFNPMCIVERKDERLPLPPSLEAVWLRRSRELKSSQSSSQESGVISKFTIKFGSEIILVLT